MTVMTIWVLAGFVMIAAVVAFAACGGAGRAERAMDRLVAIILKHDQQGK